MAVRNNATTKLILKLVNGTDAAGKEKIVQRSFPHFSDKLTDEQRCWTLAPSSANCRRRSSAW